MRTLERVEYHGRQGKPPDTATHIIFPTISMRIFERFAVYGIAKPTQCFVTQGPPFESGSIYHDTSLILCFPYHYTALTYDPVERG